MTSERLQKQNYEAFNYIFNITKSIGMGINQLWVDIPLVILKKLWNTISGYICFATISNKNF